MASINAGDKTLERAQAALKASQERLSGLETPPVDRFKNLTRGIFSEKGHEPLAAPEPRAALEKKWLAGLPKMHKGGIVPEDGAYQMKRGEMVLPVVNASEKSEKKGKKMAEKEKKSKAERILSGDKGEPEKKESKKESKDEKKKKGKMRKTEIEHHSDGSHTVRHTPEEGPEVSYAAKDLDGVIDGLHENLQGGEEGTGGGPVAAPAAAPAASAGAPSPAPEQ